MQRHPYICAVAFALALLTIRAVADEYPVPGAVPLGGEYTIHAIGSLVVVCERLSQTVGWNILPPLEHGPDADRRGVNVALDAEKASLEDILRRLCKQSDMTWETGMSSSCREWWPNMQPQAWIRLVRGNTDAAPRPTADLERYIVRISEVSLQSSRNLSPQWGEGSSATKATDELSLAGTVAVKTEAARCALIDPMFIAARAVTDTGEQLSSLPCKAGTFFRIPGSQDLPGPFGVALRFPLPKPGTRRLSKVEGALREYVTVKVTAVDIPVGSVGQDFTADDIRVHVNSWATQYGKNHVVLSVHRPLLAPPPPSTLDAPVARDSETGRIHTKPGGIGCVFVSSTDRPGSPDCTLTLDFTQNDLPGPRDADFNVLPVEVDHLRILFYRYGAETRDIPFVLTNIPLP